MINLLLFLLFLFVTIEYRVDLGPLSVALVEPIALLFSAAVLLPPLIKDKQVFLKELLKKVRHEPLVYLFIIMTVWAFFIRPWAINWKHGLSDIRDWIIPTITLVAFLQLDYRDWRKWLGLFLFVLYISSFVGIYQYFTDSARPFVQDSAVYKKNFDFVGENEPTRASFAVGFFSHPNQLGLYLFIGLMMALGVVRSKKELLFAKNEALASKLDSLPSWANYLLLIPLVLAFFWTYSKASLLAAAFALGVWVVHSFIKSTKMFLSVLAGGAIVGIIAIVIIQTFLPWAVVGSFLWRFGLWVIAIETIFQNPLILLFGNGKDIYAEVAYYAQPHNLYIWALLQYGLIGLLITLAVVGRILKMGLEARATGLMKREPLLTALWVALLGFLLISLVETTWLALLNRMLFVLVISIFIALYKEISHKNC